VDLTAINTGNNSTDALTDATLTTLLGQVSSISTDSTTIETALRGQITTLGDVQDGAANIGLTVSDAGSLLLTADTERISMESVVGDSGTPTALYADLVAIETAENGLDTTVSNALSVIDAHLDNILADDCKTNLVSIPILARDAGGFYAAPSQQLINDLQAYIDDRKEVTQVPEVVSGEQFLVQAVIRVRAGVLTNYSVSVLTTSIQAAVDGVLRDRSFGESLYLDEIYNVLSTLDGLDFVNVSILGEDDGGTTVTDKLDADGNLIISEGEVVTKGITTVVPEVVAA